MLFTTKKIKPRTNPSINSRFHLSHVKSYISDSDSHNIEIVGHRRWILNPQLKKTGFGYADDYSTMQAFDQSREENIDFGYILWPNKGDFPNNFFNGIDSR